MTAPYTPPSPTYAPPPAPRKSGLALTALIVGIVAFLTGWVPILGIIVGIVAIAFGVIGLILKQQTAMSVIGLSLGALATICSLLITIGLFNLGKAETNAAPASSASEPSEVDAPAATTEPEPEPINDGKSRETALPLGSTVTSKDWAVTINSVTLDATQAVLDANMFNSAPAEGNAYILVNATATYTGTDPQGSIPMITVAYVSPDGQTFDGLSDTAVAPEAFDWMSPLYEGASTTGNFAIAVPAATAAEGTLAVQAGMLGNKVFYSMQ